MYTQKNTLLCEQDIARIYAPPDVKILILEKEDIITKSEVGGQWPWGGQQSLDFSE